MLQLGRGHAQLHGAPPSGHVCSAGTGVHGAGVHSAGVGGTGRLGPAGVHDAGVALRAGLHGPQLLGPRGDQGDQLA